MTVDNSSSVESESVCATSLGLPIPASGTYLNLICTQPIVGRYVTVSQLGGQYEVNLALSDVQVYGDFLLGECLLAS